VVLPPKSGSYTDLQAVKGKVLYRRAPRAGSGEEKSPILFFDLEEREEKTILDDAETFEVTSDGKKLLATNKKKYAVVDVKDKQKFDKPMELADIEVPVEPRGEWRQIFLDTFRFERDFFYDPGMHGVNWNAMKERYLTLLDDAVSRWDVNWIIGEFLGELALEMVDRALDQRRPVVNGNDLDAGRQSGFQLFEPRLDRLDRRPRVLAGAQHDDAAERLFATVSTLACPRCLCVPGPTRPT
jgi:hypothetical protein